MANRATLKEAQELKATWEAKYPNRQFGYDGGQRKFDAQVWNVKWGKPSAHIIVQPNAEPDKKGYVPGHKQLGYEVFEIRVCRHGVEHHTSAVGEDYSCDCKPHSQPQAKVAAHWHDQWFDMDGGE